LVGALADGALGLARRLARLARLGLRLQLLEGRRAGEGQAATEVGLILGERRRGQQGQRRDHEQRADDGAHLVSPSILKSIGCTPTDSTPLPSTTLGLNFHFMME